MTLNALMENSILPEHKSHNEISTGNRLYAGGTEKNYIYKRNIVTLCDSVKF